MTRKALTVMMGALLALTLGSCGKYNQDKGPSSTSGSSLVYCDESFENIMEEEIDVFEYIYPQAHVLCRYGTEREAIDSLMALSYRTIVIPRQLTDSEVSALKKKNRTPRQAKIAVDAVALIVNPDNPLNNVSLKEISEILSGETDNWSQLGPGLPDKPIAVLFDKAESSMTTYMRDSLLNGKSFSPNVHAQGSIKGVVDAVKADKNAIGVIGVSWLSSDLRSTATIDSIAVDAQDMSKSPDLGAINDRVRQSGVKVLGVMGESRTAYRPFQEDIYTGKYPLTRQIWMTTISPSGSPGGGFFSFVTGTTGQKLILKTGVMPARMSMQVVELVP